MAKGNRLGPMRSPAPDWFRTGEIGFTNAVCQKGPISECLGLGLGGVLRWTP